MAFGIRTFVFACALAAAGLSAASAADAPKQGGTFRLYHRDSPATASIHEESTVSGVAPFMAIYNNLVMYDQHKEQNSLDTIVPDLATSWSWNEDKSALTFKLHEGVKWHDGKPFTAKDVQCTWDMLTGKSQNKLRLNPRASWYGNLDSVSVDNDYQATFHLKRPQPAFIALLASGYSPVYPCHVSTRDMRTKPIGTGPFKFVEYKQNESIKLARNPDYWKPGLPHVDAIEWTIITNRSTAMLAFIAGKVDMTFPSEVAAPLMRDVMSQAPQSICKLVPTGVSINLIVNREAAPFDNADIRRAMALTLDRKSFIDILSEGKSDVGAAMLPPPEGVWGMPADMLKALPGYGGDIEKNRAEARKLMEKAGYGPDKHLAIKVSTRNIALYRDPAVILIDQLKQIYIDGELDVIETANWFAKVARKDYAVGLNLTGSSVDDPDAQFYENYVCGSERNVTGYCNRDIDKMVDRQSSETDLEKRRKLVWEIDGQLQQDVARPIIYHQRSGTCWAPQVKGFTLMVNSLYNGYRFEDVWLDR